MNDQRRIVTVQFFIAQNTNAVIKRILGQKDECLSGGLDRFPSAVGTNAQKGGLAVKLRSSRLAERHQKSQNVDLENPAR
jgi:hypothetical protein